MDEIRPLTAQELAQAVPIAIHAYPGYQVSSEADWQRVHRRYRSLSQDPRVTFYGLFRESQLLGSLRLHNFTMTVRDAPVPALGVGAVAVDLLHKKQKVARNMLRFSLRHARQHAVPLALLYPFRPDFYRRMGFGYGAKMSRYRVRPASLPRSAATDHLQYATKADKRALSACYNRYAAATNGMIQRIPADFTSLFDNVELDTVLYRDGSRRLKDDQVRGYLIYRFKPGASDTFLDNDLHVHELVAEEPAALVELLTFLHLQLDQVGFVHINVQDDAFHHLLSDPRNGSEALIPPMFHESNTQGVGLMYRVVDVPGVFEKLARHDFNGQNCRLRITVEDSFLPENAGSTLVHFHEGAAHCAVGDWDTEIRLEIGDFSSLLTGAVGFKDLVRYGQAEISEPRYLEAVHRLFAVDEKPICMTSF